MDEPRESRRALEWADAGFWTKVYVLLVLALALATIVSFLVLEWRVGLAVRCVRLGVPRTSGSRRSNWQVASVPG